MSKSAIDQGSFARFLRQLRQKNSSTRVCVFLDNLAVHRTKRIQELYKQLDMKVIFNVPYSPQYNPIEIVFSIVKGHYKKRRLNYLANGKVMNETNLIRESFR